MVICRWMNMDIAYHSGSLFDFGVPMRVLDGSKKSRYSP